MTLEIALALTLYDIAWLSGDWQLTSGTRCVEEQHPIDRVLTRYRTESQEIRKERYGITM